MKRIVHDPEAQCDIFGAVRFYEGRQPGLGARFLRAVDATIVRIANDPQRFAYYEEPIRSCRVPGFPYRVLFADEPDLIPWSLFHTSPADQVGGGTVSMTRGT